MKVYVSEPWPIAVCGICRREREIVGAARVQGETTDRLACNKCIAAVEDRAALRAVDE